MTLRASEGKQNQEAICSCVTCRTPRAGKRAASQVASTTGASAKEVAGLALHAANDNEKRRRGKRGS